MHFSIFRDILNTTIIPSGVLTSGWPGSPQTKTGNLLGTSFKYGGFSIVIGHV